MGSEEGSRAKVIEDDRREAITKTVRQVARIKVFSRLRTSITQEAVDVKHFFLFAPAVNAFLYL